MDPEELRVALCTVHTGCGALRYNGKLTGKEYNESYMRGGVGSLTPTPRNDKFKRRRGCTPQLTSQKNPFRHHESRKTKFNLTIDLLSLDIYAPGPLVF